MNSASPERSIVYRAWRKVVPSTIVGRTTLLIVLLTLLFGALFSGVAAGFIHRGEVQRLRAQLDELVGTIESTASIACFVNDTALAKEIGRGLMNNEAVAAVRIRSTQGTLFEQHRTATASESQAIAVSRSLHSPFYPSEVVGEVWLYSSKETIQAQAWRSTRVVLLALAFQLALASWAVAWVVSGLITKPIKSISDELHRMKVRTGVKLKIPRGHRRDEIGRLVVDVNALIGELTDHIELERRLRMEREIGERRLASIFEKVDAGMFETDADGILRHWNPAFERTLGKPTTPPMLFALLEKQGAVAQALIQECLAQRTSKDADFELRLKTGEARWLNISFAPLDDRTAQGVINDITERKERELAAQDLATRDAVTGLLNRRGFEAALAHAFTERSTDPNNRLAVLGIDLDYFKQVNDRFGHEVGDMMLRHAARIFEKAVRRTDLVARYGGDEFQIALIGIDGVANARDIARSIITDITQPQPVGDGQEARIGASIGIALIEPDDSSPVDALRRADRALYAAKEAGRCRARVSNGDGVLDEEQDTPDAGGDWRDAG